ncbi:class I SAM-dependent methyltransferase [Niastella caeni]|uniref:Class I SAM-dependent methyltransferase n=1 Tax=Niastella caeni TaxID=2569763 RepID=A0A4S8I111_9BACT|nr:class I SAM-dependent methyltransferase [Niastella caeni]THU39352.1 class I SAM-dependent methyltransferase [Niastella caeni]
MAQKIATDFFDLAVRRKMYSGKSNLKFYLNNFFENVDLSQKEVLDVGGGKGLLSFYAAVKGAKNVVCLEPEKDGSRTGMIKGYNELRNELPESLPVKLIALRLQEFLQQTIPATYDVVIMHNSINHLDEDACIHLLDNEDSYKRYLTVFKNVYRVMKKKAVLIATDVSCNNFFNDIGMKNIFVPSIEWYKHQKPDTWISLLKAAGFKNPIVKWLTPNRLGKPGRLLLGNYFMSYLTRSFFKVTMEK